MEKNEETTMEEKAKLKTNGGLRIEKIMVIGHRHSVLMNLKLRREVLGWIVFWVKEALARFTRDTWRE